MRGIIIYIKPGLTRDDRLSFSLFISLFTDQGARVSFWPLVFEYSLYILALYSDNGHCTSKLLANSWYEPWRVTGLPTS
jgi:hypothetical protein